MKAARNAAWMRVCTVCSASIRTGDRVPRRSCSGSCSAWSMRRRGPWARAWSAIRETATSAPSSDLGFRPSVAARCGTRTTSAPNASSAISRISSSDTASASRHPRYCGSSRAKRSTRPSPRCATSTAATYPLRSTCSANRCCMPMKRGALVAPISISSTAFAPPMPTPMSRSSSRRWGSTSTSNCASATCGRSSARRNNTDSFVRIDMEQSSYTAKTIALFKDIFYAEFGNGVGVVLQSYLRRTAADVDTMIRLGARVRLCKGAYKEPEDVAFPDKRDVDANFIDCMERLMERGNYPGIATHDLKIIDHAKAFAQRRKIPVERFEFQMLYGVRRDLQYRLRREGYNMRVYVPFGTHWYPYLMRRLAERPANVAFITSNILKESVHRRR